MSRNELERKLKEAGFTCDQRTRHDVWRHPSGAWTMLGHGAHISERRREASIRSVIRRAQRWDRSNQPKHDMNEPQPEQPAEQQETVMQEPVAINPVQKKPFNPRDWLWSDDDHKAFAAIIKNNPILAKEYGPQRVKAEKRRVKNLLLEEMKRRRPTANEQAVHYYVARYAPQLKMYKRAPKRVRRVRAEQPPLGWVPTVKLVSPPPPTSAPAPVVAQPGLTHKVTVESLNGEKTTTLLVSQATAKTILELLVTV